MKPSTAAKLMLLLLLSLSFAYSENCVVLFWGKGCPHCARAKPWLEKLAQKMNFTLLEFEVYNNKENQKLFAEAMSYFNSTVLGVPTIIAGGKVFIGFSERDESKYFAQYNAWLGSQSALREAIEQGMRCPTFLRRYMNASISSGEKEEIQKEEREKENLVQNIEQIVAEKLSSFSPAKKASYLHVLTSGVTLGLADGILNPCTLSVLVFMVAYLVSIRARRRILACGLSFVSAVALVYGSFLVALLFVVQSLFVKFSGIAKLVLGVVTIIFALLEFAEAFAEVGVLRIPKGTKENIQKLIEVASPGSAFLVGALASLAEIPCAGSFPLVYTAIVSKFPPQLWSIFVLWYIIFFALPLLVLVLLLHKGLSTEAVEQLYRKNRKAMRVFAGVLLLIFGIWFLGGG